MTHPLQRLGSTATTGRGRWLNRIPLRWVLMVPFVVQITGLVGLVGGLAFRNSQQSVQAVAFQLQTEIAQRIGNRVNSFLDIPQFLNQINADAVGRGTLQTQGQDSEPLLYSQLNHLKTLSWIYFGSQQDGSFVGVTRQPDQTIWIARNDPANQFQGIRYSADAVGNRIREVKRIPSRFDSRQRPWYQKAAQAKAPIWTDIYPSFSTGELLITAAQPVYRQGALLGVVGADYSLQEISTFLSQLQIGKHGQAFIMERETGLLVADSSGERPYRESNSTAIRITAAESSQPLIQATALYLGSTQAAPVDLQPTRILLDQKALYVLISPLFEQLGLNWSLVIVIPETDFTADIEYHNRVTVSLFLTAIGGGIILSLLITRWIVTPLQQLSLASRQMAGGTLDHDLDIQGSQEVVILSQTFNQMAAQLRQSMAKLQETNVELERRVRQRTEALSLQMDSNRILGTISRCFIDLDLEPAMTTSLQQIGELIAADRGHFFVYSEAEGHTEAVYEWCRPGSPSLLDQFQGQSVAAFGQILAIMRQRQILRINDWHHLPPLTPLDPQPWRSFGIQSMLWIPIHYHGKLHGILGFEQINQTAPWTNRTIHFAKTSGEIMAAGQLRHQAQLALKRQEAQFRLALQAAHMGVWEWNIQTGQEYWSPEMATLLGSFPTPTFDAFLERVHPEDRSIILSLQDQALRTGQQYRAEYRIRWPDGGIRWLASMGNYQRNDQGEPLILAGVALDITERKEAEQALQEQQEFLRRLIDTSPDLIFVKTMDGVILLANQTAAQFFDQELGALEGIHDHQRLNPDLAHQIRQQDLLYLQSGQDREVIEERQTNAQGELRWIQWIKRRIMVSGIADPCLLLVGTDITELKEAEFIQQKAREAAEAASKAKSTFLANMSHELRTPLNAILGFSQLLSRDPQLTDKQRDTVSTINRSGEHLLSLINGVLDMAKIEAGKIVLQESPFDLNTLLKTIHEMLTVRAKAKKLHFLIEQDPQLPQAIISDENKLRQVLINLIGNALKFTEEGGVTLHVKALEGGDPRSIQFAIIDSGVGMTPEESSQLFEAFVQTDSSKKVSEGTGLGLAISREFVKLMGGDIQVTSQKGVGTTFTFSIQAKLADPQTVVHSTLQTKVVGIAPQQPEFRILIVDDQPENRDLMVQLLTSIGLSSLRTAAHGQEAVEIWETWDPHLIWMDIQMPVMDGNEATRHIKSRLPTAPSTQNQTKIIALTASAFEQEREAILANGCDDFVGKPFRESVIFEKLSHHLGIQFLYETPQNQPAASGSLSADLTREDLSVMPSDWIAALHQAATKLNTKQVVQLIETIPPDYGSLAQALKAMVKKVRFRDLVTLSQP